MNTPAIFPGQSLNDWLSYLETIHSRAVDPGLERMVRVADLMDLSPLKKSRIVTVTGTNGKGSVTNLLAACLRAAGYSCNLYNSPHLFRFNERITVNGVHVSDQELLESFNHVEELRVRSGVTLTFFEFTTLAAFEIFARRSADFLVMEVGMGGRYDSVNLLDAELAVITNVALDHTAFLGSSREDIGYQKVGILRRGAHLLYGEEDIPESVLKETLLLEAGLTLAGRDYRISFKEAANADPAGGAMRGGIKDRRTGQSSAVFDFSSRNFSLTDVFCPSIPCSNAAMVLAAIDILKVNIAPAHAREIIAGFSMPGRFQKVADSPSVYVDVGHNPHAFAYLIRRLEALKSGRPDLRFYAVVGMLRDKNYSSALNMLAQHVSGLYLATLTGPRGETSDNLARAVTVQNCHVSSYNNAVQAYEAAMARAGAEGDAAVLVAGSFLTAQAVLEHLGLTDA